MVFDNYAVLKWNLIYSIIVAGFYLCSCVNNYFFFFASINNDLTINNRPIYITLFFYITNSRIWRLAISLSSSRWKHVKLPWVYLSKNYIIMISYQYTSYFSMLNKCTLTYHRYFLNFVQWKWFRRHLDIWSELNFNLLIRCRYV